MWTDRGFGFETKVTTGLGPSPIDLVVGQRCLWFLKHNRMCS
ncbi:hypothetical protein MtrunA17_Chr3g0082291 [Medicago truncatula]|uniref:Uncharacterized protein n=1 Tax=Medicago truncatula TaxID=3880 RepID=A0A396IJ88_MEDTR|nr:hypothetical protein MtrunA17_Chr3g0082291 [Medicago truncatula]